MTKTGSLAPFDGDVAEERFSELFDRYKQHLAWVGVVIILAGVGVWFYLRSESIKPRRATPAPMAAARARWRWPRSTTSRASIRMGSRRWQAQRLTRATCSTKLGSWSHPDTRD